ncbi:MAG TPA: DUF3052 domain-containing protein [Candidatus Limnocylindria bacterium]|nr:DUF3052 domain-containing protein [Candidatus Limnocylindria bacterium]
MTEAPTGYSGTPLVRKLGLKPGQLVLLERGPADLDLAPLPRHLEVHRRAGHGPYDVIVTFCADAARLAARFDPLVARLATAGGLWVAWPKKASGVRTDLTEDLVRRTALQAGLVDVKICAIDPTWSGLKIVRRVSDR